MNKNRLLKLAKYLQELDSKMWSSRYNYVGGREYFVGNATGHCTIVFPEYFSLVGDVVCYEGSPVQPEHLCQFFVLTYKQSRELFGWQDYNPKDMSNRVISFCV